MRTAAVSGLIFANANDNLIKKLTTKRSMASIPYGSRYRLIDFSLSNLVNAGITRIGILTKENYRSLMDHVGSGIYWDLDRKNGGIYFLPPYITGSARRYNGTVDALNGARDYIKHCKSEYIVLCNADILANVDISAAIKSHVKNEADITILYHNGSVFANTGETMLLDLDNDNRVKFIKFDSEGGKDADFSIGITIIGRQLLLKLIDEAVENELISFNVDVISKKLKQYKVFGVEHSGYVKSMNSIDSYYQASIDLLDKDVRNQLFNKQRPIFTKTRDDMPTRYGIKSSVSNSLIADGCVINGTVKNSILFRGVKVETGAIVENCILMQETSVGKATQLKNVISDKNAIVGDDVVLKGTKSKHFLIKKNQVI